MQSKYEGEKKKVSEIKTSATAPPLPSSKICVCV